MLGRSAQLAAAAASRCAPLHTCLNEHKEVIGQWCGSASTKQLLPALLDLRRRMEQLSNNKHLGQCWWADDMKLYRGVISAAFDGRVGVGLHPDDSGMREDLWHGAETFDQNLQPGHTAWLRPRSGDCPPVSHGDVANRSGLRICQPWWPPAPAASLHGTTPSCSSTTWPWWPPAPATSLPGANPLRDT